MAIITDPDDLSQGSTTAVSDAVWGTPTGAEVTITSSGTELPALAAGEFFEVREHSNAAANGLYKAKGTPTTGSVTADKVTSPTPPAGGASSEAVTFYGTTGASTEISVHVDTSARDIYLLEQGNVSSDGATLQALYSFLKEEWKADATLIPHPFPITAITPEQFEFTNNWNPQDSSTYSIRTRKVIRTGGWSEIDDSSVMLAQYSGIITLGSFEDDVNDTAYYAFGNDPTDTGAAVDFTFSGPVNEAIKVYDLNVPPDTGTGADFNDTSPDTIDRNDGGSWITDGYVVGGRITVINSTADDGTYDITDVTATTLTVTAVGGGDAGLSGTTGDTAAEFATNYKGALSVYLRIRDADTNGKTYAQAALADIGVTSVDNKVFRFPLSNATDLKISETDANIGSNSPYTQILVRYFDQAFTRDVDTPGAGRSFGIVVDAGTFSGVDGVTAGGTTLTTAEAGIPGSTYDGGTLTIHEGTDKGIHTITTASGGTVNLSASLSGSESNLSFTLQRSSPVVATAEEIYEKVQYLLRQASDIDSTDQTVTGKTADALLRFVGDTLEAGASTPINPNGGGSGVIIEGFSSNDTNRLSFFDNGSTKRTYPFVAAGTINFNSNLVTDAGPAIYRMFFTYTERFTNTGFGLSAVSGDTATLDSSTTNLVSELADGDYIRLTGFTNEDNNGIFVLTGAPAGSGPWTAAVRKWSGETLVNEAAGATVSLDKNPIDSPDAIIVDNNAGVDIAGTIGGSSATFDFDYDGNVQGGRTGGVDAAITIRAIGLGTAQFVETTGTIEQSTGQVYSLVAALERNYSNP